MVAVPAIVDRATYDAVQRRLGEGRARAPHRSQHPYLLSGLVRCCVCGGIVCAGNGGPAYRYCRCAGKYFGDPKRCGAGGAEGRTVACVAVDLLGIGLRRYTRPWARVLAGQQRSDLTPRAERVLARALARFGVAPDKVADAIAFMIGRGATPFEGTPTDTPRTRMILGMAAGEARRLDHPFVGSGHLLLALIREGEGIAAGILESLGVDMLELRDAVVEFFERGEMPLAET